MRAKLLALTLTISLSLAVPAFAQGTGPNGGMLSGGKEHAIELLTSPTSITVYLLDNGKVEPPKGATVRAVVQEGSKNETVALTIEGNKLVGKLNAPLSKGARVVISGKDEHGHTVQGRFVIP